MAVGYLILRWAVEWELSGEHLIEGDADGIDVGAGVDWLPGDLLGRHIVHGPEDDAGSGELRAEFGKGQPEVEQLYLIVGGDHDVRRLDVAMNDSLLVCVSEAGENLLDVVETCGQG